MLPPALLARGSTRVVSERLKRCTVGTGAGVLFSAMVWIGGMAGCASTAASTSVTSGAQIRRPTLVKHEPCDLNASDARRQDVNGDGRSDITASGNCRAYDLNFDGKVDSWAYLDAQGKVRRYELDFDRDGAVDEIQLYSNGQLTEKQRCSVLRKRLDTWQTYQGGKLVRTERDANGDGIVDQWWDYPTPGCPVIRSDLDRDGKPDPDSAVDYCKETGYTPPERGATATGTSPSFERAGSTPQEVQGDGANAPEIAAPPPASENKP